MKFVYHALRFGKIITYLRGLIYLANELSILTIIAYGSQNSNHLVCVEDYVYHAPWTMRRRALQRTNTSTKASPTSI